MKLRKFKEEKEMLNFPSVHKKSSFIPRNSKKVFFLRPKMMIDFKGSTLPRVAWGWAGVVKRIHPYQTNVTDGWVDKT